MNIRNHQKDPVLRTSGQTTYSMGGGATCADHDKPENEIQNFDEEADSEGEMPGLLDETDDDTSDDDSFPAAAIRPIQGKRTRANQFLLHTSPSRTSTDRRGRPSLLIGEGLY